MDIKKIKNLYVDEKNTIKEVADKINSSFWKVYDLMKENNIPRRGYSEANFVKYNHYKPRFSVKKNIDANDKYLKIAGIMLYWAEGHKKGSGIDFANSDAEIIKLFLTFLRRICGVNEERLRIYLYAYEDQDINRLRNFWSKTTQIPLAQFTKPYIRKGNANLSGRKMRNGLVHIRYYDKKLLQLVLKWIGEYIALLK